MPLDEALIVLQDDELEFLLHSVLAQHGYHVRATADRATTLHAVAQCDPSLIVIAEPVEDAAMPGLVAELKTRSSAYLMVATSAPDPRRRIGTTGDGAARRDPGHEQPDEYIPAPLSLRDFSWRVGAHQSAASGQRSPALEVTVCGELRISPWTREAWYREQVLDLTRTEFDLLALLVSTPRQVHTREQLRRHTRSSERPADSHVVAMHISNLRRKLRGAGAGRGPLVTVRGVGYKCDPDWGAG